jgi:hypothetical protein
MLIRVHMAQLVDSQQKQFSATLAPVLGTTGLILPGGVFESWMLVG